MHTRDIFQATLIALCFGISSTAQSALISADLAHGSGDNLVTIDTQTQLAWLDVSLTIGQSFDQVRAGAWFARGYKYATKSDLETLFGHAGLINDEFDIASTQPTAALTLIGLLGATQSAQKNQKTYGFLGTDYFGTEITPAIYPLGTSFPALLGKIDYMEIFGMDPIGEGHFTGGHPSSDQAADYYGSFLVKSVPEPSSAILALTGLLAISVLSHRKIRGRQSHP